VKSLIAAVSISFLAASGFAGPKVKITDDTINFGKTPQQSVLTHAFWIKSVGDEALHIKEVVPGCGCTKALLTDSLIAPGDSARLQINFSTGRMNGMVAKRPYITTNASEEKQFLKIYAEMLVDSVATKPIQLAPLTLDVSQFNEKPRRRGTFKITNTSSQDLTLSVVDSSFKSFTVKLPSVIKAGATVDGIVTVRKENIETEFKESLTIATNDTESSRFTLPVTRLYKVKPTGGTPLGQK